ncbi:MAG: type II toxin-antitoxin system HicB family antitoxin [Oscillospiraceae bacterium]|nr:type II toxin-antitoxin system HicB family antitoxin [Oscillospiraceae bacterium]
MAKYVFPAIFTTEEKGLVAVDFPDIPHCYTGGDDMADAIEMAEDVLCLKLYGIEEKGGDIPTPSELGSFKLDKNSIVSLIRCDTLEYRRFYDSKSVKKTLSIPNWMNVQAEKAGINFSAVLQEALSEKLANA